MNRQLQSAVINTLLLLLFYVIKAYNISVLLLTLRVMQKSTQINRQSDILPVTPSCRKSDIKRRGNAQTRRWLPLKLLARVERREGMFRGLNKTRCPGLLSLAHMLSVAFSHSSSSDLTPQMEARTGKPPSSTPSVIVWLPVCVPISLSSCLLLTRQHCLYLH